MGTMYQVNQTTGEPSTPVLGGAASGGLTQEEHDAIMSIASMPARGDINPTKLVVDSFRLRVFGFEMLPVVGYSAISLNSNGSGTTTGKYKFYYKDGSVSEYTTFAKSGWTDVEIPNNTELMEIAYSGSASQDTYYALFTADSPLNPFNQTP